MGENNETVNIMLIIGILLLMLNGVVGWGWLILLLIILI